jgi:hypothetical protein
MDTECFNLSKFNSVIQLSQCNCTKNQTITMILKKKNMILVYISGVPRGVWGVKPPPPQKFRSFDKLSRIPSSVENTSVTPNKNTTFTHFLSCFVKRPPRQLWLPQWYFFSLSKAWHDVSIVTEKWISAIRIPYRYSARYRWSPRSHEQEEPASLFSFIVHFVLTLL